MSKEGFLCVGDNVAGMKIYEIINKYFGKEYTGWMKAWFDINDEYAAWFPKIYKTNDRPDGSYGGTKMWSNTLSPDESVIIEINHDIVNDGTSNMDTTYWKKRVVFGRIKGKFKFLGVFEGHAVADTEYMTTKYERISTEFNLKTFSISSETTDDINTPINPKNIFKNQNGTIRYECGRCETIFRKSPRCPECGQLVKE